MSQDYFPRLMHQGDYCNALEVKFAIKFFRSFRPLCPPNLGIASFHSETRFVKIEQRPRRVFEDSNSFW